LVIGITIVRADGTVAKSGGKVVKNVAGYDLGKLFAGSRGTLGLITQATFRLHPVPAATACVTAEVSSPEGAEQMLMAALEAPIAPVAAEIRWPSAAAPIELAVTVEGDQQGVIERTALLSNLMTSNSVRQQVAAQVSADGGSVALPPVPPWWHAGPLAQPDGTVVQVAFWPGDLARMLNEIRSAAETAGLDPAVGGSAGAGVLQAGLPADCDPEAIGGFVSALRAAIAKRRLGAGEGPPDRASVAVLHAPPAVGALVDLFGPVPALSVMRAVKQQFDPRRRMSPGRFAGRI
jgi:glycolate oxidase FAD binding subunit